MKIKKILATVAASALTVSALSVCAFAGEAINPPVSYEAPTPLANADEVAALPNVDKLYSADTEVTFTLKVNNMNGGWANGSASILDADGIVAETKFGGTECDKDSNRGWFPEGSVVIAEDQKEATVVVKADLTGRSGFNFAIFCGQPGDEPNGFFDLESVTVKNPAGFEATYADGKISAAGGETTAPADDAAYNVDVQLAVMDNVTWATQTSDKVSITKNGEYTFKLDGLAIEPSSLCVLYIKDAYAIEKGDDLEADYKSDISNIALSYSLKINGNDVAVDSEAPSTLEDLDKPSVFDFALYNVWGKNYVALPDETITSIELVVNVASAEGTTPVESKPEESKPEESKPEESKPEESKADENKPAESDPAASEPSTTEAAGNVAAATGDKNSPDTGVAGIAAVAGLAVVATLGVVIAKKRK